MNSIQQAQALIREMADDTIVNAIAEMVEADEAEWVVDQGVEGTVVGLVSTGTNQALAVVYVDEGDFEFGEYLETI